MGFLNSKKKWHKFWHPGFASRALRFKNFSETFSLSLSSLRLGQSDPVFFFWGAKFRQNVKNTSKNGIFNCNISPFFFLEIISKFSKKN
jgi:hypothetical protein